MFQAPQSVRGPQPHHEAYSQDTILCEVFRSARGEPGHRRLMSFGDVTWVRASAALGDVLRPHGAPAYASAHTHTRTRPPHLHKCGPFLCERNKNACRSICFYDHMLFPFSPQCRGADAKTTIFFLNVFIIDCGEDGGKMLKSYMFAKERFSLTVGRDFIMRVRHASDTFGEKTPVRQSLCKARFWRETVVRL